MHSVSQICSSSPENTHPRGKHEEIKVHRSSACELFYICYSKDKSLVIVKSEEFQSLEYSYTYSFLSPN